MHCMQFFGSLSFELIVLQEALLISLTFLHEPIQRAVKRYASGDCKS